MGLPPTHRVDHTPRIILSFDDAWDLDRINEESNDGKDKDHPWIRYHNFESRGDLSTVAAYLKPESPLGPPLIFDFRRLNGKELALIESRQTTNVPAGRNLALTFALISVEGADLEFDRGGRSLPHPLSDADMEALRVLVGDAGVRELGNHAIACSRMELTDPEKKPSGS